MRGAARTALAASLLLAAPAASTASAVAPVEGARPAQVPRDPSPAVPVTGTTRQHPALKRRTPKGKGKRDPRFDAYLQLRAAAKRAARAERHLLDALSQGHGTPALVDRMLEWGATARRGRLAVAATRAELGIH